MKFYLSNNVATEHQMLTSDRNEISAMFNVFFNARTSQLNFQIGFEPEKAGSTIASKKFDYALLTVSDWKLISADSCAGKRD